MDDTDNAGNDFRLQKISEIQKRLETEKEKRRRLTKKIQERRKSDECNRLRSRYLDHGIKRRGSRSFIYDYSSTRGNHDRNVDGGCWCTVHTE